MTIIAHSMHRAHRIISLHLLRHFTSPHIPHLNIAMFVTGYYSLIRLGEVYGDGGSCGDERRDLLSLFEWPDFDSAILRTSHRLITQPPNLTAINSIRVAPTRTDTTSHWIRHHTQQINVIFQVAGNAHSQAWRKVHNIDNSADIGRPSGHATADFEEFDVGVAGGGADWLAIACEFDVKDFVFFGFGELECWFFWDYLVIFRHIERETLQREVTLGSLSRNLEELGTGLVLNAFHGGFLAKRLVGLRRQAEAELAFLCLTLYHTFHGTYLLCKKVIILFFQSIR